MWLWTILSLVFLLLTVIHAACNRHFRVHQFAGDKAVPGDKPEWLIGSLRQMGILRGVPLHRAFQGYQQRFGDIFQFFLATRHTLVMAHPDHAQHILSKRHIYDGQVPGTRQLFESLFPQAIICLQGSTHRRHTRVVLPMLKKNRALPFVPIMSDATDQLCDAWKQAYQQRQQQQQQQQPKDTSPIASTDGLIHHRVLRHMQYLMLDLITEIAYAESCGLVAKNVISELVTNMSADYVPTEITTVSEATSYLIEKFTSITLSGLPPFLAKYAVKLDKRWKQSFKVLRAYVHQQIQRQGSAEYTSAPAQVNLLTRLVAVLARDVTSVSDDSNQLSQTEVVDELLMSIFAGYETSSTALSWFIVCMSKNTDVQARIKAEIEKVIPKQADGTCIPLTEELIDQLEYMDCVVKEILRWAPTAVGIGRYTVVDDVLDGVHIPAGQELSIPGYLFHMDPRFWKLDPTKFIPERFYGPDAPDRDHHPYAFMPFGGGHHACAGQELARIELKVIMTRLMQRVTFHDTPENNVTEVQRITCVPGNMVVRITFDSK